MNLKVFNVGILYRSAYILASSYLQTQILNLNQFEHASKVAVIELRATPFSPFVSGNLSMFLPF